MPQSEEDFIKKSKYITDRILVRDFFSVGILGNTILIINNITLFFLPLKVKKLYNYEFEIES